MGSPPKRHLLRGNLSRTVCGIIPRAAAVASVTVLEERVSCRSCIRLLELERAREVAS